MTSRPWAPGPLVTRRRLGGELRRLREASGLTLDDVAQQLECSPSKLSRLENGKGIPKSRDVRDILEVLGVDDAAERARLLNWSRTGQAKMWWHEYSSIMPPSTLSYIELEWDAARIDAYESYLVHGLVQTRHYARAVLNNAWCETYDRDAIEKLVEVRMRRQEALAPGHGLTFRCVLDESTLYRVVGTPQVLHDQLDHLISLAEAQHVDLRVLPFSVGLKKGSRTSFSMLDFTDGIEKGLVYMERPGDASDYLAEPAAVEVRRAHMDELLDVALPERDSITLLENAVRRARRA